MPRTWLHRLPQRDPHRGEAVPVLAQLLAKARREQQGVVGGRANHEDEQDALTLSIQRDDVVVRQDIHARRCDAEREQRADQHHDWQHWAAATTSRKYDDRGRQQQDPVDALERDNEVGQHAGRASHVDLCAEGIGDLLAHLLDDPGKRITEIGVQQHDGLQRLDRPPTG